MTPTIDILCTAYQAGAFIDDAIASVVAQSHESWRLWVRDDGSSDDTGDRVTRWVQRDERVHLLHRGAPNLGVGRVFPWLLDQLPTDTSWVAFLDADDVWRPDRLRRSLAMALAHETPHDRPRPILVHGDARLVDASGRVLAPSYWTRAGMRPTPTTLRRLSIQNVATSSSLLFNRPLLDRLRPMPTTGVFSHDWWIAMVAATFGAIHAIEDPVMDYRQHSASDVGATRGAIQDLGDLLDRMGRWQATGRRLRRDFLRTATQALTFAQRYEPDLPRADLEHLNALGRLPSRSLFARKWGIIRHRLLAEHGVVRNLAFLLRA